MTVIKFLLGTIIGAVLGCILSVVALYPLFVAAEGGRDINGGIAMGMVTGVAPLGTVIGAIAGFVFVLSRFNRDPHKVKEDDGKSAIRWLAGIATIAVFYFSLLLFLQGPPGVKFSEDPMIHFEVRTPKTDPAWPPTAELHGPASEAKIPVPIHIEEQDDHQLITGEFQMRKGLENRGLRLYLRPDWTLKMTIPLYPGREIPHGFNEWDGVDYMNNPQTGEVELGYNQDVYTYRYKAVPTK